METKNTKSIIELQEDELDKLLKNLTFGQALELNDSGITFEIDYKNKKVLNVMI